MNTGKRANRLEAEEKQKNKITLSYNFYLKQDKNLAFFIYIMKYLI